MTPAAQLLASFRGDAAPERADDVGASDVRGKRQPNEIYTGLPTGVQR